MYAIYGKRYFVVVLFHKIIWLGNYIAFRREYNTFFTICVCVWWESDQFYGKVENSMMREKRWESDKFYEKVIHLLLNSSSSSAF